MSILVLALLGAVALAAGAYLDHKYGSDIKADLAAVEARVKALEASAKADLAAVEKKL
ncbi:MAG: hypothetical protein ACREHV_14435 [Rhizomicrobium sp.]